MNRNSKAVIWVLLITRAQKKIENSDIFTGRRTYRQIERHNYTEQMDI